MLADMFVACSLTLCRELADMFVACSLTLCRLVGVVCARRRWFCLRVVLGFWVRKFLRKKYTRNIAGHTQKKHEMHSKLP